jgi:predicted unusual protein kinase regulating ubiquinone biosynthesis (AarF/ABC1/UbiB family)
MSRKRLSVAGRANRARRIGVTFGRVYVGIKALQLMQAGIGRRGMRRRWSRHHRASAQAIYDTAVSLRGLILKGCQTLGSRADVLPPEYVEILAALQDQVPAKPFPVVRGLVERELDRPLEAVFASFSETPIAAASLAQVHEATLHGGERVAVKVQYPEIATLVHSDLGNLHALFRAVGFVERDFDLLPLVDELGTQLPKELDFVNEGRNAEQIGSYFAGRKELAVPRIHWDYTTRSLLVMEFVDGIKISDTLALRAAGVDPNAVMRTLIEAYCEQIFIHGHFHADPHPGNLFVQPNAGPGGRPRIAFVDFGLTKQLPGSFRAGIVALAAGLFQGRADAMTQALVELGFETRAGGSDTLEAVAAVILDVATKLRHQSFVDPKLARGAGHEVQRLIREDPIVRMPSHIVLLGRVVGLLSGLGRSLDARVDMLTLMLPYALRKPAAGGPDPTPS